jgi:hypothetical protein
MHEHRIDPGIVVGSGEHAIVEPEHGDDPERNRALRHHPAEGYASHQEALTLGNRSQPLAQPFAHDRERKRWIESGLGGLARKCADRLKQRVPCVARGTVVGIDAEHRDHAVFELS